MNATFLVDADKIAVRNSGSRANNTFVVGEIERMEKDIVLAEGSYSRLDLEKHLINKFNASITLQ